MLPPKAHEFLYKAAQHAKAMNLQERMKKYAELKVPVVVQDGELYDPVSDLQATVHALEVARENLEELKDTTDASSCQTDLIIATLYHINQTLGKAGV
jgi:hypothetical protein